MESVILDVTLAHKIILCLAFSVFLASIYQSVPLMDLESARTVDLAVSIALHQVLTPVLHASLAPI